MSSGAKQTSRWGSFLQQAVAGVESRLDTILAEDDGNSSSMKQPPTTSDPASKLNAPSAPVSTRASDEIPRQSATPHKTDRLQERLAKAVGSRSSTPTPSGSVANASRSESLAKAPESPRSSSESRHEGSQLRVDHGGSHSELETSSKVVISDSGISTIPSDLADSIEYRGSSVGQDTSLSSNETRHPPATSNEGVLAKKSPQEAEPVATGDTISLLRSDYEAAELQRQDEVHDYMERIEALQAKLQYLTTEVMTSAKKSAEASTPGTMEEKVSRNEEKIALLIEEGQKLSRNELKLMTTIKKLRAKAVEDEKKINQSKQAAEKAERLRGSLAEKLKANESALAEGAQHAKRLEKELERVKSDADVKSLKISELQSQAVEATASVTSDRLAQSNALLDQEKSTTSQLEEEISTLKIEKKLADDRYRVQAQDFEETIAREKERSRMIDLELRGEIANLENRLETYRAQAEEISSGSGSDTQAKLFRQIETLQTQYSVASENWRGIESSLLARISTLEKDRDDLGSKETDSRKKLRETTTKARRAEEELEQARSRIYELDEKVTQETSTCDSLRNILEKAQAETNIIRNELAGAKEHAGSLQREIEKRDAQILEAPYLQHSAVSPGLTSLKHPVERLSYDRANSYGRRSNAIPSLSVKDNERPTTSSRKASVPLGYSPFSFRNESQASMPLGSSKESVLSGNQSPHAIDQQDDPFEGVGTPATPDKTINDMFSASTAAAGPSVQLVERMSAAVRRLEAEKAASREEIERMQSQRDEAREQVVTLMKEVEQKRATDTRVTDLENDVEDLNKRYQTTLEMLGEKSERVEELQADIEDMKQIYRDVLEKTVR